MKAVSTSETSSISARLNDASFQKTASWHFKRRESQRRRQGIAASLEAGQLSLYIDALVG
jgi:hypothetical protein